MRDEAKEEAQVARLAVVAAGDTKEKIWGNLARVKDALAAVEEANGCGGSQGSSRKG